jgi:hypothetical protein
MVVFPLMTYQTAKYIYQQLLYNVIQPSAFEIGHFWHGHTNFEKEVEVI